MTLTTVYQEWYEQRKNNNQKSFNKQLDKNITIKQPFNDRHTKYIKGALIMDLNNLKEKSIGQRKRWQIIILTKNYFKKWSRNRRFKITKDNKLRVNLKHLAHYILLQIVYIDNLYNIHLILKKKLQRYLIRIY